MTNKFKLNYDDDPQDVMDKIKKCLSKFNMDISEVEQEDGSVTYEIDDHGNR